MKPKPTTPEDDVRDTSIVAEVRRDMLMNNTRMWNIGAKKTLMKDMERVHGPAPQLFRHFRGHHNTVNSVYFHPWKETLLSCSDDGNIFAWNYKDMDKRALR
jgi:WD40 repeat protein